jgi:hypothetical protein
MLLGPFRIHHEDVDKLVEQNGVRLVRDELNGVIIYLADFRDRVHIALHLACIGLRPLDRKDNIVGIEGIAVMERHPFAQLEFPGVRIKIFPANREPGNFDHAGVAHHQRIIHLDINHQGHQGIQRMRIKRRRIADTGIPQDIFRLNGRREGGCGSPQNETRHGKFPCQF